MIIETYSIQSDVGNQTIEYFHNKERPTAQDFAV